MAEHKMGYGKRNLNEECEILPQIPSHGFYTQQSAVVTNTQSSLTYTPAFPRASRVTMTSPGTYFDTRTARIQINGLLRSPLINSMIAERVDAEVARVLKERKTLLASDQSSLDEVKSKIIRELSSTDEPVFAGTIALKYDLDFRTVQKAIKELRDSKILE
jgi:hypothetical protein